MKCYNFKCLFHTSLALVILLTSVSAGYAMNKKEEEENEKGAITIPTIQKTEQKNVAIQKKSLALVKNIFEIDGKNITVHLAYQYLKLDSKSTRFFFEGEVLIIDPATTPFEFYVTAPLLPCLFGLIHDPETHKSLVFHKGGIHNMDTLRPPYESLSPSDTKKLEVVLYSCQLSDEKFEFHKKFYGGKTQAQEMMAVRKGLKERFGIPKENTEMRFFRNSSKLPNLGQYAEAPVTIGVTKKGVIFHTSLVAEDVFGLDSVKLPPELRDYEKFSQLPILLKYLLHTNFFKGGLCPIVQSHFVGGLTKVFNSGYGDLSFFSSEELNVPAFSLPRLFEVEFGDEETRMINPFDK
jgi:hypothetical protein